VNPADLLAVAIDLVETQPEQAKRLLALALEELKAQPVRVQRQPRPPAQPLTGPRRCPHCGETKDIESDFGFKLTVEGQKRPQSWCRKCRNGPDSHVTRKALSEARAAERAAAREVVAVQSLSPPAKARAGHRKPKTP